jgi:hypothetical protein
LASLSIKERKTVINSRIVKEIIEEQYFLEFTPLKLSVYASKAALKGLLIAIKFSRKFTLRLFEFEPGT